MKSKKKGSEKKAVGLSSKAFLADEPAGGDVEAVGRIGTVPSILRAVADLTQMRFVVIAKVTGQKWIACAVLDEMDFGLLAGGELEVATTLCSEIRDHRHPIVIENASTDPVYCNHPAPKKYGIESYIAVPILLKTGEFFGTLCAFDSRPAKLSDKPILESMNLFAELVANELGSEEAYDALIDSETKRRESENRVRAVTDAMPGLISYIDKSYRYQFVNRAYTEWFGLKAEDIINRTIAEVFGEAAFEIAKPHIDLALEGRTETFEAEDTTGTHRNRTVRASYTPDIFDGDVRGIFGLVIDISEEKLAQDAIKRSEERYKAFIKHSTEGIWRFELERPIPTNLSTEDQVQLAYDYGYLAECNDTMAKQYGFSSAAEIIGTRLSDLLVADDPANVEFLRAFIESGYQLSEAESHEKKTDGKDRYFLNNFVGIVENGLLMRAWGTQRDITETKLAGDATARLAAIVVSSEDAIISKDLTGNITSWNVGATKMFGYTAEEVIGKPISLLMPPDRALEAADILRKIRREETVEHFETIRRHRDGSDIMVSLTVSPIRNSAGQVVGASKIVRDITDRKRIEETIHHNQAMLTLAMQSSRMGVWELDLATNTVSWSEELEAIFGLEKGGFGGTEEHFFALIHEDDREAAWNEVRAAIAEHRDYNIEFRFHHADGSLRWMEGRGEAVYSQKGEAVRLYGVGIDITERKLAEQRLTLQEEISELIRTLPTADELLYAVAAAVGSRLQVKRALFNEIEIDKDLEKVHRDYCAEGVASVAGVHAISSYSPVTSSEMKAGRTVINRDSKTDERTAEHYERSYEPSGERAYVAIPLLRAGVWVASLWISTDEPRNWLKEDVALLETIAERTWAAVEKMRIDVALRESQERFAKAFNSGPLVFTLSSLRDGRLVEVNQTFVDVTGYSREEAVGKTSLELGLWTSSRDRDDELGAVREVGHVRNLEYSFRTRNGEEIIGLLSAEKIEIGGEPFALSVIQDITGRKQAEESLRRSEAKYRTLFDSMDEGYCIIEVIFDENDRPIDYRFIEVNSAFERQSGMHEVTGKRMLEFVSDIESHWLENYGRVAKSGQPIRFANEYKSLHRWFDVYAFKPSEEGENLVAVLFTDITSRVRAEESLRESSEFNQDVIDSITSHIAVLDEKGVITAINEAWRQFAVENGADWTMKGIGVGTNYLDVCINSRGEFSEEADAIHRGIKMVLDGETDYFTIEYPCHSPNAERWFQLTVSPLTRTGGGAVVSHQNVTERRRAEEKIRESEARFRTMADNAPVMIWVTDATGYCTFLSQSWYDYTGQTRETGLGFGWLNAVHRDDRVRAEREFLSANEKCAPFTAEYRFANAAGEYHWAINSAQPRFDASGNYLGYVGSVVDIHERKLAQEAIVRAERQAAEEYQALLGRIVPLAATLGRARDLKSIYRAVREFISASMTCSAFFVSFFESETNLRHAAYVWGDNEEVDISELPPMPLLQEGGGANSRAVFEKRTIITNNYWDGMKDRPHVILRENGIDPKSSLIVPMMIKDNVLGTLEVQAYENAAFNEEDAVALEMAANLAAVAIENVRLIETEAAARQAAESANGAKDEFLSVLSHELRTPLNAMLGWVRMLKAGVLDAENSERALEVIERNTRLQGSLIEDLLDVSRIISGKMRIETELVDLISVVKTASETIRPLADAKDVNYSFVHEEESIFLTADAVRLQQVVSNLLQNAIKFTPAGGRIKISLERSESNAVLRVTDTGVGIDKDLLPYIFDRFRQADASARRNFTGLGLGLTIVRNIVELHGGTIEVESDGKDKGSTFTLTLPLATDFYSNLNLAEQAGKSSGGALAGKFILLVDDDNENLLPLKIFLESEKADVTPAANALEALKHLAERDFHLMITDIGMPEIDGYELVSRLRSDSTARNAALKAIALTAYASVDDRERALGSGFQAHLAKPVNFEELLSTIEKISRNGG